MADGMTDARRLRWDDYAKRVTGCFHLARIQLPRGRTTEPHAHDFGEVFWVERGSGLHVIGGTQQPLRRGDAVFIRPDDVHAFAVPGGAGLTFVNLAMPAAILREIEQRYAWQETGGWPWRQGDLPETRPLPVELQARLPVATARLAAAPPSRLTLDGFLLDLLASLGARGRVVQIDATGAAGAMPGWLADAVARFAAQQELAGGAARLAELAGRSPEHVNRTLRRCVGLTTSQLLNSLRAEYAARLLRLGDQPIAEIALACGVNHIGYFYKLFHAQFGTTPRRYRQAQRMGMDGG